MDLWLVLSIVAIVEPTYNLRECLPNELFVNLLLILKAPFYYFLQITILAVLHDDVDRLGLLVNESIMILDDVFVLQIAQNVHFRNNLRLFLVVHARVV
jgi:hypothetical protein